MNNESKIKEKREVYEFLRKQDDLGLIDKSTLNKWAALGVNINPDEKKLPERVCNKPQGQLSIDPEIYEWYTHHHTYDGKHWKPKSVIFHTDEFWNWINSITLGFVTDKIWYEPFEIYKAQAEYFKNTARNPYNDDNMELRREIIMEEYAKIDCNTLYYANHYAQYKEGNSRSGKMPYNAKEHNAIIFFLLDCSYSFILGKPRQIFATTTLGIFITKKLITQENFYMKFITEDDKTGMEILDDKVKTAYGFLPLWMRPQVARDYIRGFRLGKKINKGEYALPNSRIEVLAPSKTAINGGSPQIVFVDEVGNVPDLIPMILEARPTMYVDSNQDGNLTVSRSIVAWGCLTAGNRVWTANGDIVNIEDLVQEDGILGYDGNGTSIEPITYMQPPAEKPCYKITTHRGREIECSFDHPIMNDKKEFIEAERLSIGDKVAVVDAVNVFGNEHIEDPRFIGMLIGDGSYGVGAQRQARFYNCDEEIKNYVTSRYNCRQFNGHITKDGREYCEYAIRGITPMLKELGIHGQAGSHKRLPKKIFQSSEHDVCELIAGLFDTDGCIHKNRVKIDIESCSRDMLVDLQLLLHKIGVHASINTIKARIAENRLDRNDYYRLSVSDKRSVRKFAEKINLLIKYKQDRLNEMKSFELGRNCKKCEIVDGLRFEKVRSIEYVGMKPIYNLTAGNTNTYLAGGIVTHNTGVSANKGKNAFQSLWTNTLDFWDQKDFKSAMFVPLFFSWHARCSKDVYDAEMRSYYNGDKKDCEGMSQDEQKSIFHMHYPSVWRDMFSMASNKLIPRGIIDEGQTRIRNMAIKDKPIEGFFEPIYDYTVKYDDNVGVPYRVMGAKFVPFDDVNEDRSVISCYMLDRPEYGWKDRYYKGTDPIMTESGGSLFASTVWDAVKCRPACIMNFRRMHDHKAAFLQSLLMGLYYDTEKIPTGIPELVENNIGTNYVDFMQLLGYGRNLVYNAELQHELRGGGALWGINTKSNRKQVSVAKLSECVMTYHKNFAHDVIFRQLDTYVPIVKTTGITYEPVDKRMYKDDVLDSLAFAYICRLTYSHKLPIQLDDARAVKTAPKPRLTRDANNMLILEYRK